MQPLSFVHEYSPPAGADDRPASALTLLLLHGTGGSERDLLPLGRSLAPGAGLLSPRGQVLERGMPRFFRRLSEGVFDLEDLRKRTDDLADFLAAAAARYRFDPARTFAVGFSNGANIAGSLLLLRPEALAGAVLYRAMVPIRPERLPDLAGKPVLISNGARDPLVSVTETERLAALLGSAGADVTVEWHQAGHELTPADVSRAKAWMAGAARRPDGD